MKQAFQIIVIALIAFPAWAEEPSSQVEQAAEAPSTLYMSLKEVQAISSKAASPSAEAQQILGIPNPPPPKTEAQPGWAEELVSGVISQAARQEQLNNPDRDLRPQPEPLYRNAFPRDASQTK